jgi:hypothetical protein
MRRETPGASKLLPNFREEPATLSSSLTGSGLSLAASAYSRPDGTRSIRLSGICQRREDELTEFKATILEMVALLVVHQPTRLHANFSPLGEALLFSDDIQRVKRFQRAFFEIDLFLQARLTPQRGTWFISGCFGPHLSPVIQVHL